MLQGLLNKYQKLDKSYYYFIFIVSILLSSPLFAKGLFAAHDISVHVFRIVGTVAALKEGQIPPLVAPNLVDHFGYAWNLFYGPLSAYIPAFLKIFLPTYVGSLKFFMFLTIFFSGIAMFQFCKEYLKSSNVALLAAILYMTAPYRLVDLYVRGAIGEVLAFVFIPILFQGFYNLFYGDKTKAYLITVGGAGLVLSHNLSTLLILITVVVYVLFNIKKLTDMKIVKSLIINTLFIIGLSAFFIIPLIEQKVLGDYVVFMPGRMGSIAGLQAHAVYLHQLFFGKFQTGGSFGLTDTLDEMPYTLGLQLLLPVLLTPIVYKKIQGEKYNYLIFLFIGVLAAYATTNLFPWGYMPKFFGIIQFPWRLLMLPVFFLSIVAAQNVGTLFRNIEMKHVFALTMAVFIYIGPLISVTYNILGVTDKDFSTKDVTPENLYGSIDRGYSNEYFPVNVQENLDYLLNRNHDVIVKSGNIKLDHVEKRDGGMAITYRSSSESIVELPFIYYVGWNAKMVGDKGIEIMPFETDKGFVGLKTPENTSGEIFVKFTGTQITKISYGISILTFIIFAAYVFLKKRSYRIKKAI